MPRLLPGKGQKPQRFIFHASSNSTKLSQIDRHAALKDPCGLLRGFVTGEAGGCLLLDHVEHCHIPAAQGGTVQEKLTGCLGFFLGAGAVDLQIPVLPVVHGVEKPGHTLGASRFVSTDESEPLAVTSHDICITYTGQVCEHFIIHPKKLLVGGFPR